MTSWRRIGGGVSVALFSLHALMPAVARAVNTLYFNTADVGVTKSVAEWGVDTAWPSYDNVRQSIANMGQANVDVARLTFYPDQPLINTNGVYTLNATAKASLDAQLNLIALAGANKPITFVPTVGTTDAMYLSGSGVNVDNWVRLIRTTQQYINSKAGFTTTRIAAIEAFNEPDYWSGQGTTANLNSIITQLKSVPAFSATKFLAGSTLNSDRARAWYDQTPAATVGSTHLLGGSLNSYLNFADYVASTGKPFANPELHSLGEAIVGAEHGMTSGIWWADVLRARGLFVQASDGKRLAYAEDRARQSAAAVYRAPDGKIYAFAGGVERFGRATAYRFVASDSAPVYFNGIPVKEFMLQTKFDQTDNPTAAGGDDFQNFGSWSNQGAYADVTTDPATAAPALDGYRWKIVNAATGAVMEVAGSGTGDGALIRSAADVNGANQMWNIVRTRNGYYELFNANSGRTAEVANGSANNGASVRQWGTADNQIQQWTVEPGPNGTYYLRNAYTLKYLTANATNNTQSDLNTSSTLQRWKFVSANPTAGPKARYSFESSVNDAAGTLHATATGNPSFVAGPSGRGQALNFDGVDDRVTLPSSVANSNDITISTWVKWDGGSAWQRIFDFGNDTNSYLFLTPRSGDDTMRFAITTSGGDNEQILETDALPTGEWVHLALTLGGNTGVLYVNGAPRVAGQILLNPSDVASTLNYLGKSHYAGDPLFDGAIDDVRIYDYALDPTQIGSLVPHAWDVDADGVWASGTNWTYGVAPNGAGHAASFVGPYAASRTVTLSTQTSIGTLNFAAPTGIVIAGASPLTLDAADGTGTQALVNVTAGQHTIATPLAMADDATFAISGGASLDLTSIFDGGGRRLTKAGAGTLNVVQLRNVDLDVRAGTVRLIDHATNTVAGGAKVRSLTIASGGTLDLTDNALVLDYTAGAGVTGLLADVRSQLASGRLMTSEAGVLALGYADNATLGRTSVDGIDLDPTSIVVVRALTGDADLSGTVDFGDLLTLAKNYNGTDRVWTGGDFDYDGVVSFSDLLSLAKHYNQSAAADLAPFSPSFAADFALAQALAPEPAMSLAMLGGALTTLRRRR